jgi:RHS repeat-associated protein
MFDPYGKVTVLDGNGTPRTVNESAYGNPWTFGGRRLDQETGLMYYRARMHDTGLGRFIGRDPIGYQETKLGVGAFSWLRSRDVAVPRDIEQWYMYWHADNQPTRYVDPTGLDLVINDNNFPEKPAPTRIYAASILGELANLCPAASGKLVADAAGKVSITDPDFCSGSFRCTPRLIGGVPVLSSRWRTRGCATSSTPVSCCCLCDAIHSAWTYTIVPSGGAGPTPAKEKGIWSTAHRGAPFYEGTTIYTMQSQGFSVEVEPEQKNGTYLTQVVPNHIALGHELCGHALNHVSGPGAVKTENKIRAEHKTLNLSPRTGRDHDD